ncbi:MAG: sigma-54-dependent Fis family transcriptional regulator [Fimbriimonadaceae bacterium]|nr:sigma-54-dependent Fis family transcriptional regulator [Fimbriimonadaceae bacterium]
MPRVLIVDDEPAILTLLQYQIGKLGYELVTAANGAEALAAFTAQRPDAVLLDVNLPDLDGLTVLDRLKQADADVPVLMMTAAYLGGRGVADGMHSVQMAVKAMTHGAYDYLLKPSDEFVDKVRLSLQNAIRERQERPAAAALRAELGKVEARFSQIVGDSGPMREVYRTTEKVVNTAATVLILGESGTGKELVARAVHYNSPRRERELVILNCAAITETLLESELFGHEKGAFTGAVARKPGKFEQAHGGSIFLDEIGDMPLTTQAKVLRVLQEGEVVRVGGTERIAVDVRVIAATHRDLEQMVRDGEFREDLFYRLNVYPIALPALRQRVDDIPLLAAHFLRKHSRVVGREITEIDDEALAVLRRYHWPGNVRELENVLLRATILADGATVRAADLPPAVRGETSTETSLAALERRAIRDALRLHPHNLAAAAARLGIAVADLQQRALAHQLKLP